MLSTIISLIAGAVLGGVISLFVNLKTPAIAAWLKNLKTQSLSRKIRRDLMYYWWLREIRAGRADKYEYYIRASAVVIVILNISAATFLIIGALRLELGPTPPDWYRTCINALFTVSSSSIFVIAQNRFSQMILVMKRLEKFDEFEAEMTTKYPQAVKVIQEDQSVSNQSLTTKVPSSSGQE